VPAREVGLEDGDGVGLGRVRLQAGAQLGQNLVGAPVDLAGLDGAHQLERPLVGDLALEGGVVVFGEAGDARGPQAPDADLAFPDQLGQHGEPVAVAPGHGRVRRGQPGLGLRGQVAPPGVGVGTHGVAEHGLQVGGRQVDRGGPVGQGVAVVLEREAVAPGPEPGVGHGADGRGWRRAAARAHDVQRHAQPDRPRGAPRRAPRPLTTHPTAGKLPGRGPAEHVGPSGRAPTCPTDAPPSCGPRAGSREGSSRSGIWPGPGSSVAGGRLAP
jgi:hypothetical protein